MFVLDRGPPVGEVAGGLRRRLHRGRRPPALTTSPEPVVGDCKQLGVSGVPEQSAPISGKRLDGPLDRRISTLTRHCNPRQDKRAAFPKPLANFDFDYTLNQQVHAVRKRLHHIRTILDGTTSAVAAFSSLAEAIREPGGISAAAHDAFSRELDHISRELEAYKLTTSELLSLSSDIKSTVSHGRKRRFVAWFAYQLQQDKLDYRVSQPRHTH